jgi:hypothetical protein
MMTKAIETTGIVEAQHLVLDEPLPIMDKSHVRVIVLITKETEPKKVISFQSEDYVSKLAGLHKEIWQGLDTDNYLQQERNAWE